MKSTWSFTVLPDFGLYCSSKNFFMMRVGGQSGTAIVSVTSAAEANVVPSTSEAASPAASTKLLISLVAVILGFLRLGFVFCLDRSPQAIVCPLEERKM